MSGGGYAVAKVNSGDKQPALVFVIAGTTFNDNASYASAEAGGHGLRPCSGGGSPNRPRARLLRFVDCLSTIDAVYSSP